MARTTLKSKREYKNGERTKEKTNTEEEKNQEPNDKKKYKRNGWKENGKSYL